MNKERMRKLAVHIRGVGGGGDRMVNWRRGYRQSVHTHPCGTPASVAGHAIALARHSGEADPAGKDLGDASCDEIEREAAEWLGLTEYDAGELFDIHPAWAKDCFNPQAYEAAAELERMAEEG